MHTKRSSGEWIVRFVRLHGMRSREDLFSAEPKIESFLTDLAGVKTLHQQDLAQGHGKVYLPHALAWSSDSGGTGVLSRMPMTIAWATARSIKPSWYL